MTLCLLNRNSLCITSDEVDTLKSMVLALQPFEVATRELSADKFVSISKIIPLVHQLQSVCSGSASTNTLSNALSTRMRSRFTGLDNCYIMAAATLCDSRFKKISFIDHTAVQQTERRMTSEILSFSDEDNTTSTATDEQFSIIIYEPFFFLLI